MNKQIDTLKKPRLYLLDTINGLTAEQLNKVPDGFNNNIIWNLAHMISAQQGICYARSGLDVVVEDKYYSPYRPGTKPELFVEDFEIDNIKKLLLTSLDQLEMDYNKGIFITYGAVVTRYGVELTNIAEAIGFLPFHDGLHCGVIAAQRKLV